MIILDDRMIPLSVLREYMPKLKDEDLKELGPVEYDQSKVPEVSKKHAENVRRKVYLPDMTESFARGVEYAGLMSSEASNEARTADLLSKDTQARFKDQIEGTTNSDEVLDARRAFGGDRAFQTLNDRLNDASISPDYFFGNDLQRIQKAIEFAKSQNGGTVRFSRTYDITGLGSLYLDKTDARDRRIIIFRGDGGGIRKDDAGFIFDGNVNNSGDWFFDHMEFYSAAGAGTTIFNTDRIIRIQLHNIHTRDVDHIATSTERFMQTISFYGGSIVGGKGWALSSPCYYDFTLGGGLIVEHRENFFEQTWATSGSWQALNNVRFSDILIEGLTGKAIKAVRTENFKIDGVYFESNKGGHIDFTEADYLDGVSLSSNRFSEPEDSNLTAAIQWGGRLNGVSSRNNFVRNIPLHDTTSVIKSNNYLVHSSQDVAMDASRTKIPNIDPNNQVKDTAFTYEISKVGNTNVTKTDNFTRYQTSFNAVLSAGQRYEAIIQMGVEINRDDIVSIQTYVSNATTNEIIIQNHFSNRTDKTKYNVWVKNASENNMVSFTLYITVLRINPSIIG